MSSLHLKEAGIEEIEKKSSILANFVGVKKNEKGEYPFMIVDADEERGLYLIHYNPATIGSDHNLKVRSLRGTVVDINAGVVRETNGYTPTVIASEDGIVPAEDGYVHLTDKDGMKHAFRADTASYTPAFEGVMMFATRNQGVTDFGTHRKISGDKSWWGDSEFFTSLYTKYGGPEEEQLFNMKKKHSCFCHTFLIVDRSIFKSSKIDLRERSGYLVYMGITQQYRHPNDKSPSTANLPVCQYDPEDVEWTYSGEAWGEGDAISWFANPKNFTYADCSEGHNPFVHPDNPAFTRTHMLSKIDLNMANQLLQYGFHPELIPGTIGTGSVNVEELPDDPRLYPGEAVMCTYPGIYGPVMIEIHSKSYAWREQITDNNFSLLSRACGLLELASLPRDANDDLYVENFPIVANPTSAQLYAASASSKVTPFVLPSTDWKSLSIEELYIGNGNKARDVLEKRFNNTLLCYALSVPLHRQEAVFLLGDEIRRGRQKVIEYIVEHEGSTLAGQQVPAATSREKKRYQAFRHFRQIIDQSKSYIATKKNFGSRGSDASIFRDNVAYLVNREVGTSLFRGIREVTAALTEGV